MSFEEYDFYQKARQYAEIQQRAEKLINMPVISGKEIPTAEDRYQIDAWIAELHGRLVAPDVPSLTQEQKMNQSKFSLSEIERLVEALSLSIGDVEDRLSFDKIFTNWKNDRLYKDIWT